MHPYIIRLLQPRCQKPLTPNKPKKKLLADRISPSTIYSLHPNLRGCHLKLSSHTNKNDKSSQSQTKYLLRKIIHKYIQQDNFIQHCPLTLIYICTYNFTRIFFR